MTLPALVSWRGITAAVVAGALLIASGCGGRQSAFDPAGPQSGSILRLWWLYFGVTATIYIAMVSLISGAIITRRRQRKTAVILAPPATEERRLTRSVEVGVVISIVILGILLIGDFATGRAIHSLRGPDPLVIRVTGHQWWWEVRYEDPEPYNYVTAANEIHIPIGRAIQFELQSADVIHSFWIPNLQGKRDMIPGHPTHTFLRADRPGTFMGQCAEFCGYEHAFMRFVVVAEPEEDFRRWIEAQRQPAAKPTTEKQRRGKSVFLETTCAMCHTIRGTMAGSRIGPDLTHFGSRPLIGGMLANTRGNLGGWIVDPQHLKPGVRMPLNVIKPDELDALVDFLTNLK
jgi:cytochrome c oxidase subunit II